VDSRGRTIFVADVHHTTVPPLLSEHKLEGLVRCRTQSTFTKFTQSKHRRTFDLISNVLPFGRSGGYVDAAAAVRQAKSYSGSHPFVIRVYYETGKVTETHEQ
jgi:hypothetical protein